MSTPHDPVCDGHRTSPDAAAIPIAQSASEHVDACIDAYAERCRRRVSAFIATERSLTRAWTLQKRTLWRDVLIAPLNSLWAVPYWTLRKVCTGLDALGVPHATAPLAVLGPGLVSGYRQTTDRDLAREVFEWELDRDGTRLPASLLRDLERHPAFSRVSFHPQALPLDAVRKVLDDYSAARTLVSDLAGTGFTLLVGWTAFRSTSLGLLDMSTRFARRDAASRAASHFVLGRPAGKVFYAVFRPEASRLETLLILATLAVVIAFGSMLCALITEPALSAAGLQQRRLMTLVNKVERELVVVFGTRVKPALRGAERRDTTGPGGSGDV